MEGQPPIDPPINTVAPQPVVTAVISPEPEKPATEVLQAAE
jgi:hypothetical protein